MALVEFGTAIVSDRSNNPLTVLSQGEPFKVIIGSITNYNSYAIVNAKYYLMSGTTYCVSGPVEDKTRLEAGWTITSSGGDGSTVRSGASVNTGTNIFTYMNATGTKTRSMPINYVKAVITFSNKSTYSTNIPITTNTLTAINVRKNPVVKRAAFNRCTINGVVDDEGTRLLSTIKTSFSSEEYASDFRMNLTLYTDNGTQVGNAVNINAGDPRLSQFYSGITDSNMFINNFVLTKAGIYKMRVELGDAYEKSVLNYNIPASFVNVHLSSAANGGVALGKYSASTDAKPLFESNYDTQLKKTLTVDGALTVQSATSIKGQLSIKNDSNTNVVTLGQNGNITANGALTVNGNGSMAGLTIGANGLSVSGNGTISGALSANNGLTTSSLTDNGYAIFSGATRIKGSSGSFLNIKGGITGRLECAAGDSVSWSMTFSGVAYLSRTTPYIVAVPYNIDGENFSNITCSIDYVNATSFGITAYNRSSASHSICVSWMAFGILSN